MECSTSTPNEPDEGGVQIPDSIKEIRRRVSRSFKCALIGARVVITGSTCEYISRCKDHEEETTQLKKQLSDQEKEIEDLRKENRELENQLRQQAKQEYTAEP